MQRVKPTPGRAPGSRDEMAEGDLETSIPGPAQDGGAGMADRGREEESAVGHSILSAATVVNNRSYYLKTISSNLSAW